MILAVGLWLVSVNIMLNTGPCQGVIGVVYNQDGVVRDVFTGSPAEAAGLQLGDKILHRHSTRGKPQTLTTVKYIREEKLREAQVKRVCVRDLEHRSW